MTKQLSGIRPIFHITVIGIFHLISGFWQFLLGTACEEGVIIRANIASEMYAI